MKILYSELEDEVRDGFYIDPLMKCAWRAQLNVLEKIDEICQRHNIQYQAEWGTLLGTIRHGGFIPWDDDMDISMKREDYNKFLEVAEEELPQGYALLNHSRETEYWDVLTRVVNTKKYCQNHEHLDENYNFPFSTGMDIFPLDFVPIKEEEAEYLKQKIRMVDSVIKDYAVKALRGESLEKQLKKIETICNTKIDRNADLKNQLYNILESLYSFCREEDAELVGLIPLWTKYGGSVYPKEYYSKTVKVPFEQSSIPVPIAYDSVLKKKYGDYMKSIRKGGGHDYPYYKSQIETVQEHGLFLNQFQYSDRSNREASKEEKKELNLEYLPILEKAHLNIYKLLVNGQTEAGKQLLVHCQKCAISIGEMVEKSIVDSKNIVSCLEGYCELIFQIYQLIQNGEELSSEGVFEILQEQLESIKKEVLAEHQWKKKIVFITDKASRWNSLEGIWKAAKEDEYNEVTVLVIPYAYKRADGSIVEEHYDGDFFPEYVEIEDYKTFNLEKYHPDVIYINNPYDSYNYLSTVHSHFYTSNLVKWCEKLIYIPWFTLSEFTREDERGWQTMQHFVTMPGVVNSDQVIVQSEQMKHNYVEYLTEWAGEETRSIWEEKILGTGSSLMETKYGKTCEKEIPEEWKKYIYRKDGTMKKVILYHVNASSFVDYKDNTINKIKKVLEIFKDSKEDICLLWSWNTIMESVVETNCPELWKEFKKIVEEYKLQNWGIYVENIKAEEVASLCDAYYGDGCKLSQAMVMAEKPVMLQNYDI